MAGKILLSAAISSKRLSGLDEPTLYYLKMKAGDATPLWLTPAISINMVEMSFQREPVETQNLVVSIYNQLLLSGESLVLV